MQGKQVQIIASVPIFVTNDQEAISITLTIAKGQIKISQRLPIKNIQSKERGPAQSLRIT